MDIQLKNGVIQTLHDENLTEAPPHFLDENKSLHEIQLPNVEKISEFFLRNNQVLTSFHAPKLNYLGNSSLYLNKDLNDLYLR